MGSAPGRGVRPAGVSPAISRTSSASISTRRTAARRPLGRGPPDAAGPAAGGRVGPAPRRPGSSLRAAGWRSCANRADSRSPSSPACSAYPRRRCTAGKRPAGRSPSEPVRRTHCRCCTGKSRNARLSDPARSWPERRGRRAVRPRPAQPAQRGPARVSWFGFHPRTPPVEPNQSVARERARPASGGPPANERVARRGRAPLAAEALRLTESPLIRPRRSLHTTVEELAVLVGQHHQQGALDQVKAKQTHW